MTKNYLKRLEPIVGPNTIEALSKTRVILFGLGGVGSWCAEGLVRNGIGHVTLVDSDTICVTNINRQLQATHENIGESKVIELAKRLERVCPDAEIVPIHREFGSETSDSFHLPSFDYILDAIDTLGRKTTLLEIALPLPGTVFSSMGASCKLDPTRVRTGSFWKVEGCPLGRFVRKRLRHRNVTTDFTCVFSDENLPAYDVELPCGGGCCFCPPPSEDAGPDWCAQKKQINGSAVHVTATFGFVLAGLVVNDVFRKIKAQE